MNDITDKLFDTKDLDYEELKLLILSKNNSHLLDYANKRRQEYYGNEVFIRGLIEFTNYCKNSCFYCGINATNSEIKRFRLTEDEILDCTRNGYKLGFRTFVLQGGEDAFFNDTKMCDIIYKIKSEHPDCAVTLSIGEKTKESYKAFFDAGADRYLLRHETAEEEHYKMLHPKCMSLTNRKRCLFDLKEIGYQVGSGFMVGSPYQTVNNIIADLRFLQELDPDMIGIGPFIPHSMTKFSDFPKGDLNTTINLIAILRLMFPHALIPSTTALATLSPDGRISGIKAGANVVMPNLSPTNVRSLYNLYDNKASIGSEAAEGLKILNDELTAAGYKISTDVGNVRR